MCRLATHSVWKITTGNEITIDAQGYLICAKRKSSPREAEWQSCVGKEVVRDSQIVSFTKFRSPRRVKQNGQNKFSGENSRQSFCAASNPRRGKDHVRSKGRNAVIEKESARTYHKNKKPPQQTPLPTDGVTVARRSSARTRWRIWARRWCADGRVKKPPMWRDGHNTRLVGSGDFPRGRAHRGGRSQSDGASSGHR